MGSALDQDGSLGERDFLELCATGAVRTLKPGERLFELGEAARSMFFVRSGEVELSFPGGKGAKVVQPRGFFGELAFLAGGRRRTATAVARTDCEVVEADEGVVERLMGRNPQLLFALLRRSCAYLLDSEQLLIADLERRNEELRRNLDYLRRTREELDYEQLLAHTDTLTGLYNRRCLDEQLPKAIARARDEGSPLSVVLLDLDGFKSVNDTLGHAAGDSVLVEVARVLTECTRKSDLPCRLGGDEFAVVLPGAGEARAAAIAESIRSGVVRAFPSGSGSGVSCSAGVASAEAGDDAPRLLARADERLYRAKRGGKDRVVGEA